MKSKQTSLSSFFKPAQPSFQPRRDPPSDSSLHDTPASPFFVQEATPTPTPAATQHSKLANKFSYAENEVTESSSKRTKEQEDLHQRFVAKFGDAAENRPVKKFKANDFTANGVVQPDTPVLKHKVKTNYTPLEVQVVELKEKYPGVLLVIEVGYKYKFFGEDAKTASKILNIAHYMDHNFYCASIPTHRLPFHVRRLVNAGHKVGVVRQTETAALKAVGDNKQGPFLRELRNLYTKGTFVEEMAAADIEGDSGTSPGSGSNYLMCIVEENRGGGGPDERVRVGIVAVQPATGDIVYDSFEDTYMRSELETRVLHIQPCELLLPATLSRPTEKLIQHIALQRTTAFGDNVRVERIPKDMVFATDYNAAFTYVSDFYANATGSQSSSQGDVKSETLFAEILRLPEVIIKSLALTVKYLTDFQLDHVFKLTKYFNHFSSKSHMTLNANTMANLEIYRNSTNYGEKHSLFWILNHTNTSFGKRLLKRWVGRPLINKGLLEERTNAVEELISTDNPKVPKIRSLLKHLPDLEKGLCRIHYGKSSPSELLQVLNALEKVAELFHQAAPVADIKFGSSLLNTIFDCLPLILEEVITLKSMLDVTAVERGNDVTNLFQSDEPWQEISEYKLKINDTEQEFQEYLTELRKILRNSTTQYVTVAGIEYLVEVKNTELKKVPQNWIKISGTKAVSRFHTPFIIAKAKEKEQYRDRLKIASQKAYQDYLHQVSERYELFRDVVQRLAQLDCLLSLATVAIQPGYCKPEYVDHLIMKVENGRHPMVEQLLSGGFVPNDVEFDSDASRTMVLTGPNMGGKSSYIRQVALIAIMGQIGSYVPADSARLGILDAVYTRMGALDNLQTGESTFMIELHETSDIMKQATARSLVILDELGRGTSTHDGVAIAYAVLQHFIAKIQSITIFVTHYPSLAELVNEHSEHAKNCHMAFIENKEDDEHSTLTFLYKLTNGVAMRSYGLNVARLANLPKSILDVAHQKASEMEAKHEHAKDMQTAYRTQRFLSSIYGRISQDDTVRKDLQLLYRQLVG
ncbi:hypothetical protein INT44_002117 [Umbelopsis vinacea]|uniref:DNA mismatch repair protein MSH3 n=1 Tax=Umbelopsis vinacea TaxID=44442 RepID=A0A8H7Q3L1_9FUNG|nr:hypothetical protein INT44_002117 [Umbelopsis vinacea]